MAKKNTPAEVAPVPSAKRTPEEKLQGKADKAGRHATKELTADRAEKKANQKQTLKAAAKQLQKELDVRMSEVVARIRKETKAKLKEVVKEATQRLDADTERMFEQALHTLVRHYDSVAPGHTTDSNLPAPASQDGETEADIATAAPTSSGRQATTKPKASGNKAAPNQKPASRPASSTRPVAGNSRGAGRSRRQDAGSTDTLNTPKGTTNDSVAVDTV